MLGFGNSQIPLSARQRAEHAIGAADQFDAFLGLVDPQRLQVPSVVAEAAAEQLDQAAAVVGVDDRELGRRGRRA
jgi:hypothetical protein